MNEIKQTNFRINKASADAFRIFCEEQGINQAQGFEHLMEILALDKARATIQARETEITNFEQHAKALVSAYLHSLELNENAEARIREQFSGQIESQARTIAEYQEEISELRGQLDEALNLAEGFQSDYTTLQNQLGEIENKRTQMEHELGEIKEEKEKQLADKNSIITMLSAKLADAEEKAGEHAALKEQINAIQADLTQARQTIRDNLKDAEIAQERAVRAAEKSLETEHRKDLERLRSQNTELLQTIAGVEKAAGEQLRAVEKENANLREELAIIKANKKLK